MSDLVRYDAMCAAIDAAYEVDEVKDIRDKALAIEVYTRQAQNIEAERKAVQIRLRAERKACGPSARPASCCATGRNRKAVAQTWSGRTTKLTAARPSPNSAS